MTQQPMTNTELCEEEAEKLSDILERLDDADIVRAPMMCDLLDGAHDLERELVEADEKIGIFREAIRSQRQSALDLEAQLAESRKVARELAKQFLQFTLDEAINKSQKMPGWSELIKVRGFARAVLAEGE